MSVLNQVLPWLYERRQARRIQIRIVVRENKTFAGNPLDSTWEKYRALDTGKLQDSLRVELAKREYVHRRAQTFLSTIAVMTAFTIGAANVLRFPRHIVPLSILASGIMVAFIYLAAAGWYALKTVRPGQLHDLYLQNRMNGQRPQDENEQKDMILSLIQMNQAQGLISSTLAERTYRCVRNGVIFLVAVLLLLVIDGAASSIETAVTRTPAQDAKAPSP